MRQLERQGRPVPADLLQHLSPLGWQHINLTGDYIWADTGTPQEKLRPLRQALRSSSDGGNSTSAPHQRSLASYPMHQP